MDILEKYVMTCKVVSVLRVLWSVPGLCGHPGKVCVADDELAGRDLRLSDGAGQQEVSGRGNPGPHGRLVPPHGVDHPAVLQLGGDDGRVQHHHGHPSPQAAAAHRHPQRPRAGQSEHRLGGWG